MISIVFIALIVLVSYFASGWIKKNSTWLYVGGTVLSIITIIFRDVPITVAINKGFLGFSFFYVVMIVGLFNREKAFYKRLHSVRSVLSILGFILLTPHAIFYFIDKFTNNGLFDLAGLLAYVIMVPLFITSFQKIEEPMKMMKWKKLQRFAYIAYILIFVHLIFVSSVPNLIVYIVLFVPYIIYKPYHFFKHEKPFYQTMKKKISQSQPKGEHQ